MSFISLVAIILIIKKIYKLLTSKDFPTDFSVDFKNAYKNKKMCKKILFYLEKTSQTDYKPKTYINKNGYRCFNDSGILVHRWIMEREINRKLTKDEVVHHIDGNKLNNNVKNLMLFDNQEEHENHHRKNLDKNGYWHGIAPAYLNFMSKFQRY
jgi:hypothetical protein